MRSTRLNPTLVCLYHGLMMSLFPMAVITLFFRRDIGMSMQEIFLLQGGFGLAMVLFEFPSGFFADRFGYRRTLILSSGIAIVGWWLYCEADDFFDVVVAEALLGVGTAFISGTDAALLYESLREQKREDEYSVWWGRLKFSGQGAEGLAALSAGYLYAVDSRLPFQVEVGVWFVAAMVAFLIVEPARHRPLSGQHWEQMKAIARQVLIENVPLRRIVFLSIVLGMSSFVPVWIIQTHALEGGLSEAGIGLMWAVANFVVAICALIAARVERTVGFRVCLWAFFGLIALGYLGLGFVEAIWGFAAYFLLTAMRGFQYPLVGHREQALVPSSDRAGMLSFRSFLFRLSFLLVAAPIGFSVDRFGTHATFAMLGPVFLVLLLPLILVQLRTAQENAD